MTSTVDTVLVFIELAFVKFGVRIKENGVFRETFKGGVDISDVSNKKALFFIKETHKTFVKPFVKFRQIRGSFF